MRDLALELCSHEHDVIVLTPSDRVSNDLELIIEFGIQVVRVRTQNIEGAAIAGTARSAIDAVALFVIGRRFLLARSSVSLRTKLLVAIAAATLAVLPEDLVLKVAFLLFAIFSFVFVTWFLILTPEERSLAQGYR
ncbi:MAG: hypothetical protein WA765_05340 [Candidatus Acidiferrum sp.]